MMTELKRGKILRMNSSGKPQIEISPGEIYDDIDMFYPAGYHAYPTKGDVLVFFMHSDSGLGIAIPCGAFEDIPDLENDESIIYNPSNPDSSIKFTSDGIEISGAISLNGFPMIREGDSTTDGATVIATPTP